MIKIKFLSQTAGESGIMAAPSTSIDVSCLLPELIFFTCSLEHIKILLTMLQNSLRKMENKGISGSKDYEKNHVD